MTNYHTTFQAHKVHPTAFIAAGAVVISNVTLGADASVWFNAVLRAGRKAIPTAPAHTCWFWRSALVEVARFVYPSPPGPFLSELRKGELRLAESSATSKYESVRLVRY